MHFLSLPCMLQVPPNNMTLIDHNYGTNNYVIFPHNQIISQPLGSNILPSIMLSSTLNLSRIWGPHSGHYESKFSTL
jgi:hypothetical protein